MLRRIAHVSALHDCPGKITLNRCTQGRLVPRFGERSGKQLRGDRAAVVPVADLGKAAEDGCPVGARTESDGGLFEHLPSPVKVTRG
ncbi:MAG: hypothetical protein M3545_15730, partial [Acidobacteriota bacterium]|nr:hypothetical protein [Acidobacteriota bacterium]